MLQLHLAFEQRIGVIIVGPSGSGKSTLWQVRPRLPRLQLLHSICRQLCGHDLYWRHHIWALRQRQVNSVAGEQPQPHRVKPRQSQLLLCILLMHVDSRVAVTCVGSMHGGRCMVAPCGR
jgi:hypothetical protein